MKRGIDCEHSKITVTSVSSPDHDGLMLLATVATEKMNATQTCSKAVVIINEIKPVRNQSSATKLQTLDSFLQHTYKAKQTESVSIKKPMSEGEKKQLRALSDPLELAKYRAYIEQRFPRAVVNLYIARTETLKHAIQRSFAVWHTHTHAEKCNLYLNARYLIQTINVHASADRVKQAGTLPFMQLQGLSNHCGVCAINNVAGQEVTSVPEMN